jgi:excisionase family DNA binding protein
MQIEATVDPGPVVRWEAFMEQAIDLITAEETASKLNVTKRTVLKWARQGKLECVKISSKIILFTVEAIDRFVQSRTCRVECPTVNHNRAGRRLPSPPPKKGGDKRLAGELWKDLRKEVKQWQ